MRPTCRPLLLGLWISATLLHATPGWCAWPHDAVTNLQVAPQAALQNSSAVASDGQGGAFIVFQDHRSGNYDIYVQHVNVIGSIAPGWPPAGLAVCTAAGDQTAPVAVSDGSGGVIVAWTDARLGASLRDIFAQRILSGGAIAGGWPANGRQITGNPKDEYGPVIATDGAGGAFIAWNLIFTVNTDIDLYGARVDPSGTVIFSGPVAAPVNLQMNPRLVPDGSGGVIVAYEDGTGVFLDIKAQRLNPAGNQVYGPVTVCGDPGSTQFIGDIAGDGAGSAFIAWRDERGGGGNNYKVYMNELTPTGAQAPGYANVQDGNIICNLADDQDEIRTVYDGSHGAYVAWRARSAPDHVALQHMGPAGTPLPGWAINGITIAGASGAKDFCDFAADNLGGVVAIWEDHRYAGQTDVDAVRITTSGTVAPGWITDGAILSILPNTAIAARACVDGGGNVTAAWTDARSGSGTNIFAQRVEVFGQLGNPEPGILRLRDILADQGGRVRIDWNASYLDANPAFAVGSYWIWRQAPAAQLAMALARGARLVSPAELDALAGGSREALKSLTLRGLYLNSGINDFTWEYVTSLGASAFPTYSYVAATTTDSTGSHNYYTPFMVQARAPSGPAFWSSSPDSGYSVDNLPPVAPSPFLGAYSSGATHLHWGANTEADLFGYRLYRGATSGFVPGPGNLVVAQPDTGFDDVGPAGGWFKLSAVDVHGNESVFAVLGPGGTTSVPSIALPAVLALSAARPNPAFASAAIRFELPHATRVRLSIYDTEGRQVRTLAEGEFGAGDHDASWNLTDASGARVASGLYFIRLDVDHRQFVERVAVVR